MKRVIGIMLGGMMLSSPALSMEYDISSLSFDIQNRTSSTGADFCYIGFDLRVNGTENDNEIWYVPYDYGTITLQDASDVEVGKLDFAFPNWATNYFLTFELWTRPSFSARPGTHLGPLTFNFHESGTDFEPYAVKANYELDNQRLIDLGGACERVATGTTNVPPTADAGVEILGARPNRLIFLNGTKSYDDDGDNLTYTWRQVEGPTVTLDDPTSATPTFIYPPVYAHESLMFELIVNDGAEDSEPSYVSVIHNGRSNGSHVEE